MKQLQNIWSRKIQTKN